MVFSNLSPAEKEAFFGLLDEYFASRPEVVHGLSAASSPGNAVSSRAVANTAFNSSPKEPPYSTEPAWKRRDVPSPSPAQQHNELPPSIGRVAAAAAAFKTSNVMQTSPAAAPRPPPRKLSSYEATEQDHESVAPVPHARISSNTEKLMTQKKFGDVDLSSAKNAYLSIRHGTANKHATPPEVAPPVAPALPPARNTFGPPPVRRVASTSPQNNGAPKMASPPPPPPPPRPRVEEPQPEGDWAEALYDYSSEDPGDLDLQTGQRFLIVERTSDDWWTAEYQGRRGLVPAAYVQLL